MRLEPKVYFLGAGPGDPDLMTVKGRRILEAAEVVVFADSLISEEHLRFARPDAEIHRSSGLTLEQIAGILIDSVRAGRSVARLQSGDPSIYGAIHEQIAALRLAGIPFEIVPGVSAAFAAAAAVGAELTIPAVAQTVIFSRLANRTEGPSRDEVRALAAQSGTLVLFLSASVMGRVVAEVLAGGRPPETPCVVGYKVTWDDEIILRGTLATIAEQVRQARFTKQAIILIGDAVAERCTEDLRSSLYHPSHTHLFRDGRGGERGQNSTGTPTNTSEGREAGEHGERSDLPADARALGRSTSFPGSGPQAAGRAASASSASLEETSRPRGTNSPSPSDRQTETISPTIVAITRDGARLAGRLATAWPGSLAWVPERFLTAGEGFGAVLKPYTGGLREVVAREWVNGCPLVIVGALGIVVRTVGPLARDKRTDPAVVAIDDAGRFAISVLGGHLAGGNDLAARVAGILNAQPVITTASEGRDFIPLDLLGCCEGWALDATPEALRSVAAAAVNSETIGVWQSAGSREWRQRLSALHLRAFDSPDALAESGLPALAITERAVAALGPEAARAAAQRWIAYHPPVLVAGIGCSRGTPTGDIAAHLDAVLAEAGLSPQSLAAVASIDLKGDEAGIVAVAEERGLPFLTFAADDLAAVGGPNPSEAVRRAVGTPGVCEPAARLAAGGGPLLVTKQASARVTVAIARLASDAEDGAGG